MVNLSQFEVKGRNYLTNISQNERVGCCLFSQKLWKLTMHIISKKALQKFWAKTPKFKSIIGKLVFNHQKGGMEQFR